MSNQCVKSMGKQELVFPIISNDVKKATCDFFQDLSCGFAGETCSLEDSQNFLPWTSVDLVDGDKDILGLLEESSIVDKSVPGIDHMPGGQIAGYKRWENFKKNGLGSYAAKRNNPMLR